MPGMIKLTYITVLSTDRPVAAWLQMSRCQAISNDRVTHTGSASVLALEVPIPLDFAFPLSLFENTSWFSCLRHLIISIYTARQLSGIALLAPPFCLSAGGNLCQYPSIWGPWQYSEYLFWPSDIFSWSIITFVLFLPAFFLGSADFPNCPKGRVAHLCWSHSAMSCLCMQITISNRCDNHANQYLPVIIENIVRGYAFSEGDVENHWSVAKWHLNSQTPCSWESYLGATWTSIEDDHIKWRVFLQLPGVGYSWFDELDIVSLSARSKDIWQQPDICADIQPDFPDWLLNIAPPPHVGTQALELEPPSLVQAIVISLLTPLQQHCIII